MVIQEDNRWKVVILFKKKKNTAHVYFEHRIFLSFLAGKFDAFEQILLTEPVMKKLEHAYFFLGGKIAIFFNNLEHNFKLSYKIAKYHLFVF